jgi:hypothetical protein
MIFFFLPEAGKIIRNRTFKISSHDKSVGEFEPLTFKLGSLR